MARTNAEANQFASRMVAGGRGLVAALAAAVILAACGGDAFEAEREAAYRQAEARALGAADQAQEAGEVEDVPLGAEEDVAEGIVSDLEVPMAVIPQPLDLPKFQARTDLMKAMGAASRKVGSSDPDEAREAAIAIGEYSLAARHERFDPEGPEYEALAIGLWVANQKVQLAMDTPGDRGALQQALRSQREACAACHKVFRIEVD